MKKEQMEDLLEQDLEKITGGDNGTNPMSVNDTCECISGAGQSLIPGGGTCKCDSGAGQLFDPGTLVCNCQSGARQKN